MEAGSRLGSRTSFLRLGVTDTNNRRRQRQFKSHMPAIPSCSASRYTNGALRYSISASKRRMQMLVPRHIPRRRRWSAGIHTCRNDRKPHGAPTCARVCTQYGVCAMRRCGGTHGRTGAACTRVACWSNASRFGYLSDAWHSGRISCKRCRR